MSPAAQHAYDAGRFAELTLAAAPEDWSAPSPVTAWSARDVVGHLIEWLPGFVSGAGVSLPTIDPAEVAADPVAAWQRRSLDVQRLIEEQGDTVYHSRMFAEMPLATALDRFYTADIWMHSWDLSRALGLDFDLGEERSAAALAGMEPMDQVLRESGQFGPKVPVPETAPAQERFVGFIGRDPYWRP